MISPPVTDSSFPNADALEVLEQSPLPMVITEKDHSLKYANPAFAKYFGYTAKKINALGGAAALFENREVYPEIKKFCAEGKEWDGYAIINRNKGKELILKVNAVAVSGKTGGLIIYFSETNEARRRIFQQGQLLRATAFCSNLLITQELKSAFAEVVEIMGKAAKTDKCYIFENIQLPDSDQVFMSLVARWNSPQGQTSFSDARDSFISYTNIPGMLDTFVQNQIYQGNTVDAPTEFKKILHKQGILSYLILPILKENHLWGFIGYDDCTQEKLWEEPEVAALQLLANTIGSVLARQDLRIEVERKNQQLESAIKGSKDSLWDIDVVQNQVYYSPQMLELLGYKDHELHGNLNDFETIIHPLDRERVVSGFFSLLNSAIDIKEAEIRLVTRQKETIWARVNAKYTKNAEGQVVRVSGSNTDITMEKAYQQTIHESEEKYRQLVDNLKEVVFSADKDLHLTFLSKGWKQFSGLDAERTQGTPIFSYFDTSNVAEARRFFSHLLQTPNTYNVRTFLMKNASGAIVWADIHARAVFRENEFFEIQGTINDITEKKIAEEKLKESEEKYRLISENMSDLIMVQNPAEEFIYVSPSVKDILGFTPEEILGKTSKDFFQREFKKKQLDGEEVVMSYRIKRKDHKYIWLETVQRKIYNDHGELEALQSATRDITSRKTAEEKLKKALDKEKQLNEFKSNFISRASHEFRTPLSTIQSSVEILSDFKSKMDKDILEKFEKHADRIKNQVTRVTNLMNDVLTLGRLDAGKAPVHARQECLVDFTQSLIEDLFSNQPDGRKIELIVTGKKRLVNFDATLLTQVFSNLISNAFKYSAGKANPQLEINFKSRSTSITVRDFGIGIPQEEQASIFQSFFRAKNAFEIPGTGLGLVIAKEFVELQKGKIQVKSEQNKLTEVIIELSEN